MDDLLAEFVAETREMLEAIESEIVAWEADPADRARLDAIFRFVHTVKGNCGFFDFPRLERLSHAAESALSEVRAGRQQADSALVTAVLAIIDRIAEMTHAIEAGEEFPAGDDSALIAALDADVQDGGEIATSRPGSPEANGHQASTGAVRTVRLPVDLLDRVMSGVSDLVLARNDLARRMRELGTEPAIDGPFERLSATLGELRDSVSRMRMQRVEQLFNMFPRLVRDLSAELGKQVLLDFDGAAVELDREMIEMVRDPLTHIVRNALDHGIETPSKRLAAGKREIATLAMSARQSGNEIVLVVSDDGRGIDTARLAAKAVAAGIISAAEAASMAHSELVELIFEPGLSTAEAVSTISGRGVGMDVVRSNIERLGGQISVSSEAGNGTVFMLRLPLTLSIIAGLTVSVAGQSLAIPHSYVDEIVHMRSNALEFAQLGDSTLVTFRGERILFLDLADILGLQREEATPEALVILRLVTGENFALGVDRVLDHEELVIKPLPLALAQARIYAGVTLLDDGRPLLLLDVPQLAKVGGLVLDERTRIKQADVPTDPADRAALRRVMLFYGLDGRRRAMPMELVRRIDTVDASAIDLAPGVAQAVVGETILPLAGYEYGEIPRARVRLLRLSDGASELVYVVREVADTVQIASDIVPVDGDPAIEGVTLIEGESVPIVDGYSLFAGLSSAGPLDGRQTCVLPDDAWCHNFLAPLVRSAGYTVVSSNNESADVAFAFAEGGVAPGDKPAGRTILLRSAKVPLRGAAGSIYRYDRAAILDALSAGGAA